MTDSPLGVTVRRARTSDIPRIKHLVDTYAGKILLEKNLVTLYESVQEFWVAERAGEVVGCGALHVLWADLGEVRTVAVDPTVKGQGVGHAIVGRLLEVARELELQRLFVLTFETEFFGRHGFFLQSAHLPEYLFQGSLGFVGIHFGGHIKVPVVHHGVEGGINIVGVAAFFPDIQHEARAEIAAQDGIEDVHAIVVRVFFIKHSAADFDGCLQRAWVGDMLAGGVWQGVVPGKNRFLAACRRLAEGLVQ